MVGGVGAGSTGALWYSQGLNGVPPSPDGGDQTDRADGAPDEMAGEQQDQEQQAIGSASGKDGQDSTGAAQPAERAANGQELTPEQQREVRELEQIDRNVRQHEQAHLAAAGGYARGGATFQYASGPDGRRYAVGGGSIAG